MSEDLTVSSGSPANGGGSFIKNLGIYAHIAEISLIAGSAIYFYSRNTKLEARIIELEKKLSELTPTSSPQNSEERQKEMNDVAGFIYHKLRDELQQELREGKKKKKVHINENYSNPEEIQVATSVDIEDDIENELKKEM